LKPERWGSPLVQEKYQEEKACDKRHEDDDDDDDNNNNCKWAVTLWQWLECMYIYME